MNAQPDDGLSPVARDVQHEVARLDREWRAEQERRGTGRREPTGPELARLLLAAYVPPKKRWWRP